MNMKDLIRDFPKQLVEGVAISNTYKVIVDASVSNIVICGLGGSGIGGEIIKECLRPYLKLPVEVCHSYSLPEYVDSNTLVIVCSYSGNTEETLNALDEAIERKANIIGITSGGAVKKILLEQGNPVITVPGGLPPRAALAHPLVQLFEVFIQNNFVNAEIKTQLTSVISFLEKEQSEIKALASQIMEFSDDNKLLFYGEDKFHPVMLRACQQINENSKELAFFNVIPEMNHNEIVGWAEKPKNISVVMLRSDLENSRNSKRLDITHEIILRKNAVLEVKAKGNNFIEQAFYLIHLVDWLSLLKAEKKSIDVIEVDVIDYLKNELSK